MSLPPFHRCSPGLLIVGGLFALALGGCRPRPAVGFHTTPRPLNGPAHRGLADWARAYNTGRVDSLRAFFSRSLAPEASARRSAAQRAEDAAWVFLNVGPIEIVEVDSVSGDTLVSAIVRQPRLDAWGRARARVAAGGGNALQTAGMSGYLEDPPARYAPPPGDAPTRILWQLETALDHMAATDVFSGVVLVARGDSILLHRAFGFANQAQGIPNRPDSRFELASVGKMFTGVAIGKLVEQGKLTFGDTLAALLPDYRGAPASPRITLGQLLTHTSGLPDYLLRDDYQAAKSAGRIHSLRDVWPFFSSDTLDFAPGSRFEYSNSNYALLGAIIERLSGQPFAQFLQATVFGPAGMSGTWRAESLPVRALGYTRFDGKGPDLNAWHALPPSTSVGGPAGGGTAPAIDLFRFVRALLSHRLLSPAVTDSLLVGRVPSGPGERSGFGFDETTRRGVRYVGHNGGFMGVYDEVDFYPALGYTTILLSNYDLMGSRAAAEAIRRAIARMAAER